MHPFFSHLEPLYFHVNSPATIHWMQTKDPGVLRYPTNIEPSAGPVSEVILGQPNSRLTCQQLTMDKCAIITDNKITMCGAS